MGRVWPTRRFRGPWPARRLGATLLALTWVTASGGARAELSVGSLGFPALPRAGQALCVRPGGTPPDFATVQGALDAAAPGDTIRVAAGTYAENLLVDKTVTLEGGWDDACAERDPGTLVSTLRPPATPPDSERRVMLVTGLAPVIDGFTITGGGGTVAGNGDHGGGVALRDSEATIRNSLITGNRGFLFGGGIWVQRGAPRLEGNRIEDNRSLDDVGGLGGGGGVYLENARGTLIDNVIGGNATSEPGSSGGGLLAVDGGPHVLTGNLIRGNRTPGFGGGVRLVTGAGVTTIQGGELARNAAGDPVACDDNGGGGLHTVVTNVVLDGVRVTDNCGRFGSLSFNASSFTIRNSLIAANRTAAAGVGGIGANDGSTGTVVNVTLAGNQGIGIEASGPGNSVTVTNAILIGHPQAVVADTGGSAPITFSLFFDNAIDAVGVGLGPGLGNLVGIDPHLDQDLAPLPGSPAIDAGTNVVCPATDFRGGPRPRDGNGDGPAACDLGAFEGPTVARVLDLDGDGRADVGVFHTGLGEWRLVGSTAGPSTVVFGQAGDWPVPGDYDGDGRVDLAVYRPATGQFLIQGTTAGLVSLTPGSPGNPGGIPVPADYDGDGRTDPAVYHPALGLWEVLRSAAGPLASMLGGTPGDQPAPADYDGDGKVDLAVFRGPAGEWHINGSAAGPLTVVLGGVGPGLVPVPADYDGDGRADPALFQPAEARATGEALWRLLRSTAGLVEVSLGEVKAGATPVPADYDGDGVADPAVFERTTGAWRVLGSTAGPLALSTGAPRRGEVPVGLRRPGR